MPPIDYDSVAALYDAYITADFDVAFFRDEARQASGPVLELMSGTGRLSIPLIEAGAELTCVDRSRGMLDVLAKKLAARGLRAEVCCADVSELDLPPRFDLAILPFHAFMELVGEPKQRAALEGVHAVLRPGGRFICTMHNPAVRRRQVDGMPHEIGHFPFEGGTLVVSGVEHGATPVVSRVQTFELFRSDGALEWSRDLPMEFEMVERDAFERLALAAGFRIAELFGDYERRPFDSVSSPAMIWMLGKPA